MPTSPGGASSLLGRAKAPQGPWTMAAASGLLFALGAAMAVALFFFDQASSMAPQEKGAGGAPLLERRLPPPRDTLYNTSAGIVADKINVHLVPHSHDDVGWLKTFDQYYTGANMGIQKASVELTLDTVVDQLIKNPDRKFVEVEQAFFNMWYNRQTAQTQAAVRELVRLGQLEFINGGWAMHDEAATHYIDMIDQTTLGHRFLASEFGVRPKVAWQIDPFGHSAVQGYLLGAEAGFDGVFFARADYQDAASRNKHKANEFIWRGSDTLGTTAQMFGGRMYHHYMPPDGFNFEFNEQSDYVRDDPTLDDMNLDEKIEAFVSAAVDQADSMRTNHVMWAMGEDFAYINALTWYKSMDKLIHYANLDGRVNALYSTPSIYLYAKHAANATWPLKTGDFFPYADCPHCYWTGYFTSRPALKGYVRQCSGLLMAARQLEVADEEPSPAPRCPSIFQGQPTVTQPGSRPRGATKWAACCGLGSHDSSCWTLDLLSSPRGKTCPANTLEKFQGRREDWHPEWDSWQGGPQDEEGKEDSQGGSSQRLEHALAVVQHHDGVSGTAQQHVTDDYTKRLASGASEAAKVITAGAAALFRPSCGPHQGSTLPHKHSSTLLQARRRAHLLQRADTQVQAQRLPEENDNAWSDVEGQAQGAPEENSRSRVDVDGQAQGAPEENDVHRGGVYAREAAEQEPDEQPEQAHPQAQAKCKEGPSFRMCPLLNISYCPTSQADLSANQGKTLVIVAYNPLAWARHEYIRVPVVAADVAVTDAEGAPVDAQILPTANQVPALRSVYVVAHGGSRAQDPLFDSQTQSTRNAPLTLVFRASVAPLSFATFYVAPCTKGAPGAASQSEEKSFADAPPGSAFAVYFKDGLGHADVSSAPADDADVRASLSLPKGRLTRLYHPRKEGQAQGFTRMTGDKLRCYLSAGREVGPEPSGAYIFRPSGSSRICPEAPINAATGNFFRAFSQSGTSTSNNQNQGQEANAPLPKLRVFTGPLVVEVQRLDVQWGAQAFRFYKEEDDVELQYTVGPVPLDGIFPNMGREVIQRFASTLKSNATFYTDSNGRDYLKRVRDFRQDWDLKVTEPVAGNYYPVNAGIYISDGTTDLSVLVDRAAGASSIRDGHLEVMVHRRLQSDDNRGVRENLDEQVCPAAGGMGMLSCYPMAVTGTMHVSARASADAAKWRRTKAQRKLSPLQLSFSIVEAKPDLIRSRAVGISSCALSIFSLPPNVALITLQRLDKYILLRLAHLYEAKEHPEMSKAATVDLRQLLGTLQIKAAVELSLTANQRRADMKPPLDWNIEGMDSHTPSEVVRGRLFDDAAMTVELGPMEIRSFAVYVD